MRLLITGGTGFIGQHTALNSLHEGAKVTLLVREAYGMGTPLPAPLQAVRENLNLVYADLRNFQLTRRAVRDAEPEVIIHLAAQGATAPFLPVDTAVRHNLTGTLNLLRAAFEQNPTPPHRLIIARTPGELTKMNSYAASKSAAWGFAEMYARTQGWPILGAMIFQAYGPGQPPRAFIPSAVRAAQADELFPMTPGEQTRDFIHVADVAAGLWALTTAVSPLLTPSTTVELGTGQATSLLDVAQMIYELAGTKHGRVQPGTLPTRPGETPQPVADLSHTTTCLNWHPQTSLRHGLQTLLHPIP